MTIMTDPLTINPSTTQGYAGTTRWSAPELLDPESFGMEDSHPTKESDVYALGMVTFEVL
jgi:serine/threonine protein kinase